MLRRSLSFASIRGMLASVLIVFGQAPARAADKDCSDFSNQRDAQIFFLNNGGPHSDPHRLDADGDGIACESNPCPCYYDKTLPGACGGSGGGGKAVLRQRAKIIKVIDRDKVRVRLLGGPSAMFG